MPANGIKKPGRKPSPLLLLHQALAAYPTQIQPVQQLPQAQQEQQTQPIQLAAQKSQAAPINVNSKPKIRLDIKPKTTKPK